MEAQGYWLRNNYILKMDKFHIQYIIDCPTAFGLTKEIVLEKYDHYDEILGIEGKAREDLIKLATTNGWIRVRHYVRPTDYWSIQCDVLENRLPSIRNFIRSMIYEYNEMSEHESLVIVGFENGEKETYNFIDGGAICFLDNFKQIPVKDMHLKRFSNSYILEMAK